MLRIRSIGNRAPDNDQHSADGFWRESAYYALRAEEVTTLHNAATSVLQCIDVAANRASIMRLFERLAIPVRLHSAVRQSWLRGDFSIYGRLDFAWDGHLPPKLLEYNADTPTSLYEAAVQQSLWREAHHAQHGQYNSIQRAIEAAFVSARQRANAPTQLHFTFSNPDPDDQRTSEFLRACAERAGYETKCLEYESLNSDGRRLFDESGNEVKALQKLHPWEQVPEGSLLSGLASCTHVYEPAWRLIMSSKLLLADLWELFPNHPNLLPTFRELEARDPFDFLAKTPFGREGDGVVQALAHTGGAVSYQKKTPMARFDEETAVFGVWVAASVPCGLGIREDPDPITGPAAHFVPHIIC